MVRWYLNHRKNKKELEQQKRADKEKLKRKELMQHIKEEDRVLYANELDKYYNLADKFEKK